MKTLNTPGSKLSWIGLVLALLITLPVGRTAQATIIDMMLVYDTTATSWVSTNGGMTAFSQDVINRLNQATQNSGVDLTFRLVHAMSVEYTTTSGPSTPLSNDLYALRAGTGVFAPVHAARDTYGADLVAMLVDHGSAYGYVGVGYMLSTWSGSPAYGFTVNAIRAAAISHVVTHEIGHNLGAHHSKNQSQSPGPNTYLQNPAAPYSAGWYFTGTDGVSYHTIMAYNDDGQQFYEPAPLFSSPLKSYSGTTAGHAQDGDNTRVIGQSKDIVADYRPTTANTYTLTVVKSGNGSGTVSGNGSYTSGATVNLTATPVGGSTFSGWSPSPCAASFTMPASNLTCIATFNTVNPATVPTLVFSGDYNGDRRADLIWRHETTGQVYGVLLDGYSIVQQGMVYTESNTAWRIIHNGDFNGDGRDELLWWNNQTGQVYQMSMNGLNIAGGAQIYQEPNTTWQIVAVGDLNGDGKEDLIWWNNSSGQVYGMVVNGSGIAQGGMIYQEANTAWRILAARDFNADGMADLLWRNMTTGQVYLMLMNGLSSAGGATIHVEPNLAWSIVAVGDLNGDRKADLIWWNSQTGQVYGMLMNGTGIAQGGMIYQEANTAWQIIASGDYTGDGKTDLLWRNSTTGQVYAMVMNGLSIAGGAHIYQEANANWRILATAAEVPHLPAPGSDPAPLTGKPINTYRSFEGPLVNPSPPLSGAPLDSGGLPATE